MPTTMHEELKLILANFQKTIKTLHDHIALNAQCLYFEVKALISQLNDLSASDTSISSDKIKKFYLELSADDKDSPNIEKDKSYLLSCQSFVSNIKEVLEKYTPLAIKKLLLDAIGQFHIQNPGDNFKERLLSLQNTVKEKIKTVKTIDDFTYIVDQYKSDITVLKQNFPGNNKVDTTILDVAIINAKKLLKLIHVFEDITALANPNSRSQTPELVSTENHPAPSRVNASYFTLFSDEKVATHPINKVKRKREDSDLQGFTSNKSLTATL